MAAITQLSPMGMPGRRYGSFAGRTPQAELSIGGIHLYLKLRQRLDLTADMRQRLDLTLDMRQDLNFTELPLGGEDH